MIEKPKLIDPENHIYSASAEVESVYDMRPTDKKSNSVKFELMPHDRSVFKLKHVPFGDITCLLNVKGQLTAEDKVDQKINDRAQLIARNAKLCIRHISKPVQTSDSWPMEDYVSLILRELITLLPEESLEKMIRFETGIRESLSERWPN